MMYGRSFYSKAIIFFRMIKRGIDKILSIILIVLIFSMSTTLVYSITRNVAEEPGHSENVTVYPLPKIFNSTPDELDMKLLEILQKMEEAINITKKVDPSTARTLEKIRDRYITNAASGNFDLAERDIRMFSQILMPLLRDLEIRSQLGSKDYRKLSDVIADLYMNSFTSGEIGEIVNPPEEVTLPPSEILQDFNVSINPSLGISPSMNTHLYGISYYIAIFLASVGFGLFLYFNRRRIIGVLEDVSIKIGIRRPSYVSPLTKNSFYLMFLEIAKKRGYPKEDYEGPVEHVLRIDDRYLKSIGYEVAYTFEDYKYGLKEIEEDRLTRIYNLLRGRR